MGSVRQGSRVRPAKIRSGVRRRWFGYAMSNVPLTDSSVRLQDVGTPYGGWLVPDYLDASWTCYCVGIGGDVSLERHLLERGCLVRSVDPVERFVIEAREELAGFPRFTAHHAAVADADGTLLMQRHHEPVSSSLSGARLYDSSAVVPVPARSLRSLMEENEDSGLDLLKLDVEGMEYELIPALGLRELGVRVLCTQLHHNRGPAAARALIRALQADGYRYVGQRPAVKLTFISERET